MIVKQVLETRTVHGKVHDPIRRAEVGATVVTRMKSTGNFRSSYRHTDSGTLGGEPTVRVFEEWRRRYARIPINGDVPKITQVTVRWRVGRLRMTILHARTRFLETG